MKWAIFTALALLCLKGVRASICRESYGTMSCNLDVEFDKPVEYNKEVNTLPGSKYSHITFSYINGSIGKQTLSSLTPEANSLEFHSGNIKEIGEGAFCSLPKVETITIDQFVKLPVLNESVFKGCDNLKNLKMVKAKIETNIFKDLVNLEELYLVKHNISRLTRDYFEPLKNLKVLELVDGHIGHLDPGIFCISPELKRLTIVGNTGLRRVTKSMFDNCNQVEQLSFHGNVATRIDSDAFSSFTNIKSLNIDYLDILHLRSRYIPSFSNVEDLFIHNGGDTWLDPEFLSSFPKLRKLEFGYKNLDSIDPEMLSLLPNLVELDLTYNNIRNIDDVRHTKLETLRLRFNKIKDVNVSAVKANLPNLKILDISCNEFEEEREDALKREFVGVSVITSQDHVCSYHITT